MDLTLLILLIAVQSLSPLGSLPQEGQILLLNTQHYVSFFHVTYQTYNFMFIYEIN